MKRIGLKCVISVSGEKNFNRPTKEKWERGQIVGEENVLSETGNWRGQ